MPSALQQRLHTQNKPLEESPTDWTPLCPRAPTEHWCHCSWAIWSQTRCVTFSLLQSTARLSYSTCRLPSHTSQEIIPFFLPNRGAVQSPSCTGRHRRDPCLGSATLSQIMLQDLTAMDGLGMRSISTLTENSAIFAIPSRAFFSSLKVSVLGIN